MGYVNQNQLLLNATGLQPNTKIFYSLLFQVNSVTRESPQLTLHVLAANNRDVFFLDPTYHTISEGFTKTFPLK